MKAQKGLISEITVHKENAEPSDETEENPCWTADEETHPDPERGCIRRGACCRAHPGWFAPGEPERAADHLGMTPDAFVRRYLVIDSVDIDGTRVEAFAPVKLGRDGKPLWDTGTRVDRLYRILKSPCVFYGNESGCAIYPARPIECRHYDCTKPENNLTRRHIGQLWRDGTVAERPRDLDE